MNRNNMIGGIAAACLLSATAVEGGGVDTDSAQDLADESTAETSTSRVVLANGEQLRSRIDSLFTAANASGKAGKAFIGEALFGKDAVANFSVTELRERVTMFCEALDKACDEMEVLLDPANKSIHTKYGSQSANGQRAVQAIFGADRLLLKAMKPQG